MDTSLHDLSALFKQLGLPAGESDRQAFLQQHGRLSANIPLPDAPFWSRSQAMFLREAISDDADWAQTVDRLDAMLRT